MPHAETPFEYRKLPQYPHMKPADTEIWNEFIENNPGRFGVVYYDYHLGRGAEMPPDCPGCVRHAWHDLTRGKCDVVAEDERTIYTIEIKPHANAKALGQALGYMCLYRSQHRPEKPVLPVVLTNVIFPDTQEIANFMGVKLWLSGTKRNV